MSVELPALPLAAEVNPVPIEFGGALTPLLGGPTQDMQRLGDHWSIDVQLPPLYADYAALVYGARMDAKARGGETVVMPWPQPRLALPIGVPAVNGAGQAGTSLIVDGVTGRLILPAVRFFSFQGPTQDGLSTRHYLHMVTAPVTFDAFGNATLSIWPMLRVAPPDDAALDFITPKIEGFIHTPANFGLMRRRIFALASFTLAENE